MHFHLGEVCSSFGVSNRWDNCLGSCVLAVMYWKIILSCDDDDGYTTPEPMANASLLFP